MLPSTDRWVPALSTPRSSECLPPRHTTVTGSSPVTAESLPSDPSVIEFSGAPDRFRDRYLARCGATCSLLQPVHIAPSVQPEPWIHPGSRAHRSDGYRVPTRSADAGQPGVSQRERATDRFGAALGGVG